MAKFVKGQSGNPKWRPEKEWTWGSLIKEMSQYDLWDGKQRKVRIVEALLKKAEDGDTQAFKELANRSDGMPKQAVDVTSDGKELQPVLVKFIDADKHSDWI